MRILAIEHLTTRRGITANNKFANDLSGTLVSPALSTDNYSMNEDNLLKRITIEPGKCGGRACIRGMRIRVTDVIELLASGASFEEVIENHPDLERDDIQAALLYKARQV